MAKKYIEREAVNCLLDKFIGYLDEDIIYRIKQKIKCIPSVDVHEVVRCGYCRNYCKVYRDCNLNGMTVEEDDFCSHGVKMDKE